MSLSNYAFVVELFGKVWIDNFGEFCDMLGVKRNILFVHICREFN